MSCSSFVVGNRLRALLAQAAVGNVGTDAPMDNTRVTTHYDERPQENRVTRKKSPIYQMRQFNNWLKSVLIYLHTRPGYSVLDLCCGKGGDLHKWAQAGATSYVACDTSLVSVQELANRYNSMRRPPFRPSLLVGDCFDVRLTNYLSTKDSFDIVSCQFAMHYAFEDEARVRRLLENVADRLKPGGFFIGTTVDSNVLVRKIRAVDDLTISSAVYTVKFEHAFASKKFKRDRPYGIRYSFTLDQSVEDCPEYLVHFPTFKKVAAEYDLELVMLCNFHDFFVEFSSEKYPRYRDLLFSMRVLNEEGTIVPDQWDAVYLYTAFAFKKGGELIPGIPEEEVLRKDWPAVSPDEINSMT